MEKALSQSAGKQLKSMNEASKALTRVHKELRQQKNKQASSDVDLVGEQEGTESEGTETGEEEENERGDSDDEESDAPPTTKVESKEAKELQNRARLKVPSRYQQSISKARRVSLSRSQSESGLYQSEQPPVQMPLMVKGKALHEASWT